MRGPSLKLLRAKQQIQALQLEVRQFTEDRDYAFGIAEDTQTREGVAYVYFSKQPPDNWSVVIGEIIHDLRSCLDHIVYQLALRHSRQAMSGSEFPIFTDAKVFYENDGRGIPTRQSGMHKIRGVAPLAQEIIRDVQPFNRGQPERHVLWVLQQYSNIDKHRMLQLTQTAVDVSDMTIQPTGDIQVGMVRQAEGPMVSGDELARWQVVRGTEGTVNVNCRFTIRVAFDHTAPEAARHVGIIDGLESVVSVVEGIGGMLKPFLD